MLIHLDQFTGTGHADLRDQLGEMKWLREVVVSTEEEPRDPFFGSSSSCEYEDHRRASAFGDPTTEGISGEPG